MAKMNLKNRYFQHGDRIGDGNRGMAPSACIQENKIRNLLVIPEANRMDPSLYFFDHFPFMVGLKVGYPVVGKFGLDLFENIRHALMTVNFRLTHPQKVEVRAIQYPGMDVFHEPKGRR